MKITSEILREFNACEDGIKFIEAKYPDGIELVDIDDSIAATLPTDYLHFARKYFVSTPEEIEKYNKACNIENSSRVINSDDIHNSKVVINSTSVNLSEFVFNSNSIEDSSYIYGSSKVRGSKDIRYSERVQGSGLVIDSVLVDFSEQIVNSNFIEWCNNILLSNSIKESEFIYKSENLVDCYFGGFLKNCKHCLFCVGLNDVEYYIFNKKVTVAQFEELKEQLLMQIQAEEPTFVKTEISEKMYEQKRFIYNERFDSVFNGISNEFYKWVKSLYWYSNDVFTNLFLEYKEI